MRPLVTCAENPPAAFLPAESARSASALDRGVMREAAIRVRTTVAALLICVAAPSRAEILNEMVVRPASTAHAGNHAALLRRSWLERVESSRRSAYAYRSAIIGRFLQSFYPPAQGYRALDVSQGDLTLAPGDILVSEEGFQLFTGGDGAPDEMELSSIVVKNGVLGGGRRIFHVYRRAPRVINLSAP